MQEPIDNDMLEVLSEEELKEYYDEQALAQDTYDGEFDFIN